MTANGAALAITPDQRRVLVRYGSGEHRAAIADRTGLDAAMVAHVLNNVAGNDRNAALRIVKDYDERAKIVAAARGVNAPARPDPATRVEQADEPAAEHVDGVVDLLDHAEASGVPKLERLAARIRAQIQELQDLVGEHARDKALRDAVDDLEARLAAAKAQLRATRRTAPAVSDPVEQVDAERGHRAAQAVQGAGR